MKVTREAAWELLTQNTKDPSLIKHALAVEAAMRAYARRFGEDEEYWAATALVHDHDYEQNPDPSSHPMAGAKNLEALGWPADIIEAVKGHAKYLNVPRTTPLAKALFAVDELTGLIIAVALVRPSKNIADVTVQSVKKKWKDKAFAAGVNRADIEQGAQELGVDLWEHVSIVLEAMKGIADKLELDGRLARQ
ncbi:MAG: HDIG domain-containing protein [Anaerolineae bacterium]|nr:HDIG domain-containing protein [Anaerolineae bacterium]